MGRKSWEPSEKDRKTIQETAGHGVPVASIARIVGVDETTLRKHCEEDLLLGRAHAQSKIAKTLFQKALSGDVTSLIFWTKCQMRWRESDRKEDSEQGDQQLTQIIFKRGPDRKSSAEE